MCEGVYIDNKELLTQGELVAYCPKGLVFYDKKDVLEESLCLCVVDLEKTAKLNGFDFKYDIEFDSFSPNLFLKRRDFD